MNSPINHSSPGKVGFVSLGNVKATVDSERILTELRVQGYDMIVGAREANSHASRKRLFGNTVFNKLVFFMTGQKIEDLTSGFRPVRAKHFKKFLYLLPNGFSYPTTSTMAFFRYYFKDRRAVFTHELFLPTSVLFFLFGMINHIDSYVTSGKFSNGSLLLYVASVFIFLMGILSEQISSLHYRNSKDI